MSKHGLLCIELYGEAAHQTPVLRMGKGSGGVTCTRHFWHAYGYAINGLGWNTPLNRSTHTNLYRRRFIKASANKNISVAHGKCQNCHITKVCWEMNGCYGQSL